MQRLLDAVVVEFCGFSIIYIISIFLSVCLLVRSSERIRTYYCMLLSIGLNGAAAWPVRTGTRAGHNILSVDSASHCDALASVLVAKSLCAHLP